MTGSPNPFYRHVGYSEFPIERGDGGAFGVLRVYGEHVLWKPRNHKKWFALDYATLDDLFKKNGEKGDLPPSDGAS